MLSKSQVRSLQHARRFGMGRLLLLARRDFLVRVAARIEGQTGKSLVHSTASLLAFIDLEGTRSTELARRAGVSKQAVGRLIRDLEKASFVKRTADQADGRAFLVSFTASGLEYVKEIHRAIGQVEREYSALVGAQNLEAVRTALSGIVYANEPGGGSRATD